MGDGSLTQLPFNEWPTNILLTIALIHRPIALVIDGYHILLVCKNYMGTASCLLPLGRSATLSLVVTLELAEFPSPRSAAG